MPERAGPRAAGGCGVMLGLLLAGALAGGGLVLAVLGVGPGALLGRATGQSGPLLVATAEPTPVRPISGGLAPGRRAIWAPPIALESDTQLPDLLLVSYNYETSQHSLVRFSPDAQAVRWESPPLGDDGASWVVAADAEQAYVADGARLVAIGLADGALRWEAPLTDRIFHNVCRTCLRAVGGVVVALSDDGVLQAVAAASGAPAWSHRLNEPARQLLLVDGLLGVPDAVAPDESESALYLFRPADGAPAQTIAPSCIEERTGWVDNIHYFDPVFTAPDGAPLWLLDSSRCLVRGNIDTGDAVALATLPESVDLFFDPEPLFADGAIYIGGGGALVAVRPGGELVELLSVSDYELRPLLAGADTLLVGAVRTRGTARVELWAVDPASGERRWERPIGEGQLSPSGDGLNAGGWSAAIIGDTVALIERRGEPEQIGYDLLSLRDGASRASVTLAVEDPSDRIRGVVYGRDQLLLVLDELYAVQVADGRLLYRVP